MKSFYPYFFTIVAFIFFSCEEIPELGIVVPELPSDGTPETTLNTEQTLYNSSTVDVSWEGNEYAKSFQYRLESLSYDDILGIYDEWSTWDTQTDTELQNLDDGFYTFYVQSRYTSDLEESEPQDFTFQVDAVAGSSIRIYPLYQQVETDASCDFYVYAENVSDLAGMEIEIAYDPQLFSFGSIIAGESFSNAQFFLDEIDEVSGNIYFLSTIDQFDSINGTVVLAKITLIAKQFPLSGPIEIKDSSILRDTGNHGIEIQDRVHGEIEVIN